MPAFSAIENMEKYMQNTELKYVQSAAIYTISGEIAFLIKLLCGLATTNKSLGFERFQEIHSIIMNWFWRHFHHLQLHQRSRPSKTVKQYRRLV